MHLPQFLIIITISDIIIKTLLLIMNAFPGLGLDWKRRILLHYMTTLMVLGLRAMDFYFSTDQVDYLSKLDPYCGLFASMVLTIIALPTTFELLSYFMANTPESFRVDDFIIEITQQFPNIECSHIHVYKQWPPKESKFDVLMHIKIKVDQTAEEWMQQAQKVTDQTIKELKSILARAGARKVTIEPRIDDQQQWTMCTTAACQTKELTCCNRVDRKFMQNNEVAGNSA